MSSQQKLIKIRKINYFRKHSLVDAAPGWAQKKAAEMVLAAGDRERTLSVPTAQGLCTAHDLQQFLRDCCLARFVVLELKG